MINYIEKIKKSLSNSEVDGWLFYSKKHNDPIAMKILNIPAEAPNSRPWIYVAMKDGPNIKICHKIESSSLSHLDGELYTYYKSEQFESLLEKLQEKVLAVQTDYLSYGASLQLHKAGIFIVPSSELIQKTLSLLTETQIQSHEKAGKELYDIIQSSWNLIQERFKSGIPVYEGEIRDYIIEEFNKRGLKPEIPIVASGKNSGNPHYLPVGNGEQIKPDNVLQLDIFSKFSSDDDVFADISWVGYTGKNVPAEIENVFSTVQEARDRVVAFIENSFLKNEKISGSQCDKISRDILTAHGFEKAIQHRTGHCIDTEIHGSGVNLDSVENPDMRFLEEGSCFSVEPGIYTDKFGMRTEIDVYIKNGKPVISGGIPQKKLLTF